MCGGINILYRWKKRQKRKHGVILHGNSGLISIYTNASQLPIALNTCAPFSGLPSSKNEISFFNFSIYFFQFHYIFFPAILIHMLYSISKMFWPILHSYLLYKIVQDFFVIQYSTKKCTLKNLMDFFVLWYDRVWTF